MSLQKPFRSAQFLTSAPSINECPPEIGREVAFAGRSNAGKSSAINTLTGQSKLAKTSKTPGRTQLLNFFNLGDSDRRLVDLPGYGYAKVSQSLKKQWQKDLSEYLHKRECLTGLVLLMDIRHPMQPFDTMLLNWAVEVEMPTHLLLTKSDKLKRGAAQSTLLKVQQSLKEAGVDDLVSTQTFSALKHQGIDTLVEVLTQWLYSESE